MTEQITIEHKQLGTMKPAPKPIEDGTRELMDKDYFERLSLKRNADELDVNNAFKKYGLKYHPQKNPQQMRMFLPKFHAICEAYEVLSNQQLKTLYESYGKEGLRRGVKGPDGVFRGGYQYQDNCYDIFDKFFLEQNPFFDLCTDLTDIRGTNCEIEGSFFGTAFRGMRQPDAPCPGDIDVTVEATLEEFFNGSKKNVTYDRQVLGLDGRTIKTEPHCVNVFVRPGMPESETLKMNGLGNQSAKNATTDLNIKFKMVPSEKDSNATKFMRKNGNCLLYKHTVSLVDVIQCKPVRMTTLCGRNILIAIDQIQSPGSVKVVQGEGFVNYKGESKGAQEATAGKPEQRGDLYIVFDVQFPSKLSVDQKQEINDILC